MLATNQGLLYVLSMVVIGGMVGGGSLGYIVVSGFSQDQLFGKGLAAGIAIAALGVMLDRIARYAPRGTAADDDAHRSCRGRGDEEKTHMARGLQPTRLVAFAPRAAGIDWPRPRAEAATSRTADADASGGAGLR